jgi:AhpD family alkylhydroperoxidase
VGNSIVALETYMAAGAALEYSTLTPGEVNAVQLTVSAKNECHYCTRAHTALGKMLETSPDHLAAIRQGELPGGERMANLVSTTRLLMDKKGFLNGQDLEDVSDKGISRTELYDIIAIIAQKTISNYVNHIANTRVDDAFSQ